MNLCCQKTKEKLLEKLQDESRFIDGMGASDTQLLWEWFEEKLHQLQPTAEGTQNKDSGSTRTSRGDKK